MKKLLVAALMVVLASPAFAAIQNVKVSGDITTSSVNYYNFDLGYNTGTPSQPYGLKKLNDFLTQTRLRVDADLSDNVSTTVGLINERAWNAENSNSVSGTSVTNSLDTNVQLYLASLTLREFLYSPLTLQIGRQVFSYGNGLILGDGGAINQGSGPLGSIAQGLTERTAYDGVTATLDYKPLTISTIYFKNGQNNLGGFGHVTDGQSSDVFGYNANYQLSDAWNTVVEQYVFARVNGAGFSNGTTPNGNKANTLFVPGLRASTNPTKSLNLQAELAWQLGNAEVSNPTNPTPAQYTGERREAMAAQLLATYSLPVLEKYKPSVNAAYTYVSGDKNANQNQDSNRSKSTKVYSAWDEFNTTQGAGTIYRSILPLSNEHIIAVGGSVSPLEDVTVGATWTGLWAAEKVGGQNPLQIYQPNTGSTLASPNTSTKKNSLGLGNEADVNFTYNYTEDVTFGVSLGWFVPGNAFATTNRDTASQAIANVGVKF